MTEEDLRNLSSRVDSLQRGVLELAAAMRRDAERLLTAATRIEKTIGAKPREQLDDDSVRDLYGSTLETGYDDLAIEGVLSSISNSPQAMLAGTTEELHAKVEVALVQLGRTKPGAPVFRSTVHFGRRLGMVVARLRAEDLDVEAWRDAHRCRHWRIGRRALPPAAESPAA